MKEYVRIDARKVFHLRIGHLLVSIIHLDDVVALVVAFIARLLFHLLHADRLSYMSQLTKEAFVSISHNHA